MSDEEQITRVARALCAADGQDPEAAVTVRIGSIEDDRGGERYERVTAPAWTTYASEARRFIAAARALGLMD